MTLRWPEPYEIAQLAAWDPRPPRVARTLVHLVPSVGWGGAERLACTLHRMARLGGWRSRIDAPSLEPIAQGIYEDTGERPEHRAEETTLEAWALAARARIAIERPSIVHVHLAFPDRYGLGRLVARGRPLVASFGLLPQRDEVPWPPDAVFHQRCDRALAAWSRLPPPTMLVAASHRDHQRLARWVPASRLTCVPNEPPLVRAIAPVSQPASDPWPDSPEVVRLLSVGRAHSQKGYDRALAALAHPALRALPWHWVVAGDGDELAALRAQCEALGLSSKVTFLGSASAECLYPRAQLLLSFARYEGMPLVPYEAIDARVPVLATSIPPHREQLAATPEALLPDDDEGSWPARIAALIISPEARATLLARQRAARPADPQREFYRAFDAIYAYLAHE